jgi:DNA-binding transcriptional MocR family regulator
MAEIGYIKLWRQMRDNPTVYKDADHIAVWVELLFLAQFHPHDANFGGERITLQPGQLITGRKKLATKLGVSESKVQRILKCFESEHMIEQQTDNRKRLITIVSWSKFQQGEQQDEQQVNSNRTASEQQVNTYKERKKERNKEYHHHSSGEGKRIEDMTEDEKNAYHARMMARFYGEHI